MPSETLFGSASLELGDCGVLGRPPYVVFGLDFDRVVGGGCCGVG